MSSTYSRLESRLSSRPAALRAGILREVCVAGCEPIFGLMRLRPRTVAYHETYEIPVCYTCMRVGIFLHSHPPIRVYSTSM